MSCGTIDIGSAADCENIPESGTRARLVLMNWADVYRITESNGIITSIELYPGKQAYEFLGFRTDVKKADEVVKTVLKSRFKHHVGFIIYERDQIQKNNIWRIVRGRFLAVVENNGKDENSIEVLGKNVGLQIVGTVIRNAYENGGFFVISLSTPENGIEFEKKLPQNLGYSYGEGLSIIYALLNPGEEVPTFDSTAFTFDSSLLTFDQT